MGIGELPFTSIDRYADRYGVTDIEDFDMLRGILREMDAEYRKLVSPRDKKRPVVIPATDSKGIAGLFERLTARGREALRPRTKSQTLEE